MKTIEVEQRSEEWLEARQTVITGTRVKAIKPLARKGKTGTQPAELWKLIAEYVSYGAEEESPMVRGTQLENENAEITVAEFKLKNPRYDCGMWETDDELLGYSPDAAEDKKTPTWAIECKSLATAEHLYLIMADKFAKGELPDIMEPLFPARPGCYRGIDSVAEEHQHQVRQAFVVNPKLKTLYYSLYDPRVVVESMKHYVITVKREEIEEDITEQRRMVYEQAELAKAVAMLIAKIN
ncbi:MAG: hypothetical protein IIY54_10605 [Ruminococcus sp.]|nr:hypothetical protein [Ruminococcus sp.]